MRATYAKRHVSGLGRVIGGGGGKKGRMGERQRIRGGKRKADLSAPAMANHSTRGGTKDKPRKVFGGGSKGKNAFLLEGPRRKAEPIKTRPYHTWRSKGVRNAERKKKQV